MKKLGLFLLLSLNAATYTTVADAASNCHLPENFHWEDGGSHLGKVVTISWHEPIGSCSSLGSLAPWMSVVDCKKAVEGRGGDCFQITDYEKQVDTDFNSTTTRLQLCWVCLRQLMPRNRVCVTQLTHPSEFRTFSALIKTCLYPSPKDEQLGHFDGTPANHQNPKHKS